MNTVAVIALPAPAGTVALPANPPAAASEWSPSLRGYFRGTDGTTLPNP